MKPNEQVGTTLGTIILVVITVTVGIFVWTYEKGQRFDMEIAQAPVFQKKTVKSDLDQTQMNEVLFCGKIYRTNRAVVDGIDVVQRIAEIATAHPEDYVCNDLENMSGNLLEVKVVQHPNDTDYNAGDYYVEMRQTYKVSENRIYKLSGFDGTPVYYGDLKSAPTETVSFCGKAYKTNGAIVEGVDVVQRIAEIATAHPEDYVCNNIQTNQTTDTLTAKITKDEKSGDYFLDMHSFFEISGSKIYKVSGLDGTRTYYGDLK